MKPTGTLKLIDKKLRLVAVYGPLPPARGRPRLLIETNGETPPELGAFCIGALDRVAKFMIDPGITESERRYPKRVHLNLGRHRRNCAIESLPPGSPPLDSS